MIIKNDVILAANAGASTQTFDMGGGHGGHGGLSGSGEYFMIRIIF